MAKFEDEDVKIIKNNLKKVRLEKGLTLKDLEKMTGLSDVQLHRFENNERTINNEALVKLCNALQCNPIQLLGEDNFEFKSIEFFSKDDIDMLRLLKQLNDRDREDLTDYVGYLIYRHQKKDDNYGEQ